MGILHLKLFHNSIFFKVNFLCIWAYNKSRACCDGHGTGDPPLGRHSVIIIADKVHSCVKIRDYTANYHLKLFNN
jgi:hypothetical protein